MSLGKNEIALSRATVRDIESLVETYRRTGNLSFELMASLKKFHDSDQTRDEFNSVRYASGMDFDPFLGQEPSNPWYQGDHKAPYNSQHFKCLSAKNLLSHSFQYAITKVNGGEPKLSKTNPELFEVFDEIRNHGLNQLEEFALLADTRDMEIIIYRVVPDVTDCINPGDWVCLTKNDAQRYLDTASESSKIITASVPSSQIFWDGCSIDSEGGSLDSFGYDPRESSSNRGIPGDKISRWVGVAIDSMIDTYQATGVCPPDTVQQLQKFYDNPQTREELSDDLKQNLGFNPFTGEKFNRDEAKVDGFTF